MALEKYELLELLSRAFQRAAEALKDDDNIGKDEIIKIVIDTLKDIGVEYID